MLRHDALDLLDDADARMVAAQTVECTAFLWDLHQQGHLRTDFQPLPLEVGHHVPCHLKALGRPPVGPALLALIPGLRVRTIDVSCSGMAGTYGLKAENYAASLAAGRPMLEELARPGVVFGFDRVQHLPHPDGGRHPQAHAAPGPVPRPGLRLFARAARTSPPTHRQAGAVMMVHVRLFARARDLAGADSVAVELPDGATVADLRRRLAADHPAASGPVRALGAGGRERIRGGFAAAIGECGDRPAAAGQRRIAHSFHA